MGSAFDFTLVWTYLPLLLAYLPITLLMLVLSMTVGCVIGLLLALARLYQWPLLDKVSVAYISFFRATPLIVQLMFVFYGVPALLLPLHIDLNGAPAIAFVIATLGLHSGASLAESIRGAVNAVDRGQLDAAYAIGLGRYRTFSRIVAPQAARIVLPNFTNTVIACLKDTSLAFSIGVIDMVGRGMTIGNVSFHLLEVYLALGVIYYCVSWTIGGGLHLLERKFRL
jgi:L-cystine transport system permease protein